MKNIKKLLFIPVLALGTISSCFGTTANECPEVEECEKCNPCPTPSVTPTNPNEGTAVTKDNHSLSVELKEIKVLVDPEIGKTKQIVTTVSPSTDTITYQSSDESVAVVSATGVITGKKANSSCIITVKSSANLTLPITVRTYSTATYFVFNGNIITSCVDQNVEDLEFPSSNPLSSTGQIITKVEEYFSTTERPLSKLKRLKFPETLTEIGGNAFFGYSPLCEYLYIPAGIPGKSFGWALGLPNLKNIEIAPENTSYKIHNDTYGSFVYYSSGEKNILAKAFNYKNPEGNLLFDNSEIHITDIYYWAFCNVSSLVDIEIPEGITVLQGVSFHGCNNLKRVKFPSTLSYAGNLFWDGTTTSNSAFPACPSLERLIVDENNTNFTSRDKDGNECNAVIGSVSRTIGGVNRSCLALIIGTKISDLSKEFTFKTFENKKIDLIDSCAFMGRGLSGVYEIPSSVKYISETSFVDNEELTGIYLPNTVEYVQPAKYRSGSAGTYSTNKYWFYQGLNMYDNNGNYIAPITPTNLLLNKGSESFGTANEYVIGTFVNVSEDFKIYYQTRNDNSALPITTNMKNIHVGGYSKVHPMIEVVDSTLTEPGL